MHNLRLESLQLLRVREAAHRVALSRSKLYQLMDAGALPYVKLGRSRRIALSDLLELVDRSKMDGPIER